MDLMKLLFDNPGLQHVSNRILRKLGPKEVGRCRQVSKCWREYIDTSQHWYNLRNLNEVSCIKRLEEIIDLLGKEDDIDSLDPPAFWLRDLDDNDQAVLLSEWVDAIYGLIAKSKNVNNLNVLNLLTKNMNEYCNNREVGKKIFRSNSTPLHWAISKSRMGFIEILPLSLWTIHTFGDDPFAETPFGKACKIGNKEVVLWILKMFGDFSTVDSEILLKWTNPDNLTESERAFFYRHRKIVQTILEFAIDRGIPNITSEIRKDTPLHLAVTKRGRALRFLLNHINQLNLDVFARDSYGFTAFELACRDGKFEMVELFLEYFKKEDIDINSDGMNPLIYALKGGGEKKKLKMVKMLVEHCKEKYTDISGLDNDVDQYGRNALQLAYQTCSQEIVSYLVENGFWYS